MPSVAFDVIGTMFTLDRPRRALAALGAPPLALELWFAQALRDAFALSHAGGYAPLAEVLRATLRRVASRLELDAGPEDLDAVLGAFRHLDPVADAGEAVDRLSAAGWRIMALTNGSEESTRNLLRGAGLEDRFVEFLSCDSVRTMKPHPSVYAMARERAAGELWMIAAHAWDIAGAVRAGLHTAWVSRLEGEYLAVYPDPDVRVQSLAAAADALIARATP